MADEMKLPDGGSSRFATGGVVFLAASLFYLFTTGQHSFWLDSMEFVTVAKNAGVPHPPGTPLYVILSSLATLLPVGAVAFRVHLLNALLGGVAAWLVFLIGYHVAGDEEKGRALRAGLAGLVALAVAISPAIWFQSVRAEVYTLNSVVNLGVVYMTLRWSGQPAARGYLPLIALLVGLGVANHHFLTLLTAMACCLFLLMAQETRKRLLSRSIWFPLLFGLGGVATYLYLPVRAADGWLMWGDPTTPSGFLSILSAEAFHISVSEMPRAPFLVALLTIFEKWIDLLGYPLFLAGAAGLVFLLLKNTRVGLFLLMLILAGGVSKAIMYLDVENPDDHAYFLTGIQALAISSLGLLSIPAGLKLKGLAGKLGGGAVAAALAATALWSGTALYAGNAYWCSMDRFYGPDSLNRHFHEKVAPDSLFMPSYYATFFNHLYFREVEKRRPDLIMVHQSLYSRFGGGTAYAQDMVVRYPEVAPVFDEYFETGHFPLAALRKVARERIVLLENDTMEVLDGSSRFKEFELGEGGLTVPVDTLLFSGPGLQLRDSVGGAAWEKERQIGFWTDFYTELRPMGEPHPELAKLLVWYHYRNALLFINKGIKVLAHLEVTLARRHQPNSKRLFELDGLLRGQ